MNDEQLLRYSRQIMLPQIDIEGQERLLSSSVLILGLGGLGCPAALYLAAAGVGQIVLVDPDTVDTTNLHRQLLYCADDQGAAKVSAAQARLSAVNNSIQIETIHGFLEGDGLLKQVKKLPWFWIVQITLLVGLQSMLPVSGPLFLWSAAQQSGLMANLLFMIVVTLMLHAIGVYMMSRAMKTSAALNREFWDQLSE